MPSPAITGAKGRTAVCQYTSGQDPVGESSVATLTSAKATAKEFAADIKARSHDGGAYSPKRVAGPWRSAYTIGPNEIYVLKGRHIFHVAFQVRSKPYAVVDLAKTAARKL